MYIVHRKGVKNFKLRPFGALGRAIGLLDFRAYGHSGFWAFRFLDFFCFRTFGILGFWAFDLSDFWSFEDNFMKKLY